MSWHLFFYVLGRKICPAALSCAIAFYLGAPPGFSICGWAGLLELQYPRLMKPVSLFLDLISCEKDHAWGALQSSFRRM